MINKILTTILLLTTISTAFAGGKKKYPVADIPPNLLINAKAVLRTKTFIYKRKDINSAVQNVRYAVTVLNKGGEDLGYFVQPYYKFSRISGISAVVYDRNGKKVKAIPKSDIQDIAVGSFTSLYSDQRIKLIDPEYGDYPFTVEYTYTINYNGLLTIPSWQVYPAYDMSVQEENFTLITPGADNKGEQLGVKYYLNDSTLDVKKEVNDKNTTYTLNIENLPAIDQEDYTWSMDYVTPTVKFAPKAFSIGGFEGSFDSWEDFGGFEYQLIDGRDKLPEETVLMIKKLVANDTSKLETIEKLYSYMQNKVRYVSVQKGIGGWQPFEAEKVDNLCYGDCKALTNYMKSLLKVAGIKADFTLVYAGDDAEPVIHNFPSNQFNHAILCVPAEADTVWLECTSQHAPCGYLGSFTDDRDVLAIDDSGKAIMLHTPVYGKTVNNRVRSTTVKLNNNGDCNIKINTTYRGMFYDDELPLYRETRDNQKKELLSRMHLSTITLNDYNFTEIKQTIPLIQARIELNAKGYVTKSGNRMLLTPYLFSNNSAVHFRHKKRRSPIVIQRSYSTIDTVVFNLPQGYVASNFKAKTITGKFGTCNISAKKESGKIIYTRHLSINKGVYPPSDWESFISFKEKIDKADKTKMVLMKVK